MEGMGAVLRFEVEVNVCRMSRKGKNSATPPCRMRIRQISIVSEVSLSYLQVNQNIIAFISVVTYSEKLELSVSS